MVLPKSYNYAQAAIFGAVYVFSNYDTAISISSKTNTTIENDIEYIRITISDVKTITNDNATSAFFAANAAYNIAYATNTTSTIESVTATAIAAAVGASISKNDSLNATSNIATTIANTFSGNTNAAIVATNAAKNASDSLVIQAGAAPNTNFALQKSAAITTAFTSYMTYIDALVIKNNAATLNAKALAAAAEKKKNIINITTLSSSGVTLILLVTSQLLKSDKNKKAIGNIRNISQIITTTTASTVLFLQYFL
jgi:hypothetical protein